MVTKVGTPAVSGPVIVLNAKWCVPAGITEIEGLVPDVSPPAVAETVWVPTVFSVTENDRYPPAGEPWVTSAPDVGFEVKEPVAEIVTVFVLGTGFQ